MAASIFQKFLRTQSLYDTNLINHPPLPPTYLLTQISQTTILANEIPLLGHRKLSDSRLYPSISSHIYPSFSFGFFLHPVFSSIVSIRSEPDDENVSESPLTIWADSVKKKRKRKMNRHKLRKLRKSLKNKRKIDFFTLNCKCKEQIEQKSSIPIADFQTKLYMLKL